MTILTWFRVVANYSNRLSSYSFPTIGTTATSFVSSSSYSCFCSPLSTPRAFDLWNQFGPAAASQCTQHYELLISINFKHTTRYDTGNFEGNY